MTNEAQRVVQNPLDQQTPERKTISHKGEITK